MGLPKDLSGFVSVPFQPFAAILSLWGRGIGKLGNLASVGTSIVFLHRCWSLGSEDQMGEFANLETALLFQQLSWHELEWQVRTWERKGSLVWKREDVAGDFFWDLALGEALEGPSQRLQVSAGVNTAAASDRALKEDSQPYTPLVLGIHWNLVHEF